MLNELNGLIDQNCRLVKEVDEQRLRLSQREEGIEEKPQNCDDQGNQFIYTEQALQAKLAEDRETVQGQLTEF